MAFKFEQSKPSHIGTPYNKCSFDISRAKRIYLGKSGILEGKERLKKNDI